MNFVDNKYLHEVAPYLKGFNQKSKNVWNCRCPYCGDSKTNKRMARGYFIVGRDDGHLLYSCHNCGVGKDGEGVPFGLFLQTHFPNLFTQYKLDNLKAATFGSKLEFEPSKKSDVKLAKIRERLIQPAQAMIPLGELPVSHVAVKYLQGRKIPDVTIFSYTSNFSRCVAEMTNNDPRYEKLPEDERIIIPIYSPDGVMVGFQGRRIAEEGKGLRYYTIKLDEDSFVKIFGLNQYDKYKPGFILEGPFDSTFLPNTIAMCGSSLDPRAIEYGYIIPENTIIVYDNESRNKEIVGSMEKAIDRGFRVFIPPNGLSTKLKDVNNMILDGINPREIVKIFVTHSYSGLKAKATLIQWKKVYDNFPNRKRQTN